MKLSSPLNLAQALALCVFISGNSLRADEHSAGTAPTPISSPASQQRPNTGRNEGGSTNSSTQPAPLIRDADDPFEGTWDIEASWRRPVNGDYEALHRALTTVNFMATSRSWVGIELGGGLLELRRGTWASEVARDPIELEAAITYRYFFNEPGNFIRPYFHADLGWFVFIWDYREPLVIDGDVAHMDYVWGIDPSLGLGVDVELTKRLNVFGEAEAGAMIMPQDTTYHHVYNDFFDSFGYFGLKAGLRLKF